MSVKPLRDPDSSTSHAPYVQDEGHSLPPHAAHASGERGRHFSERPKHKELEKVDVSPYPDITKLLVWKANLVRAVVIAANNPDVTTVVNWVQETWACWKT
jgi:hypothetical protein